MLFVDVNVTPGQPPERIVLFQATRELPRSHLRQGVL